MKLWQPFQRSSHGHDAPHGAARHTDLRLMWPRHSIASLLLRACFSSRVVLHSSVACWRGKFSKMKQTIPPRNAAAAPHSQRSSTTHRRRTDASAPWRVRGRSLHRAARCSHEMEWHLRWCCSYCGSNGLVPLASSIRCPAASWAASLAYSRVASKLLRIVVAVQTVTRRSPQRSCSGESCCSHAAR